MGSSEFVAKTADKSYQHKKKLSVYAMISHCWYAIFPVTQTHIDIYKTIMDLLPDTQNCGLYMRRECRERFPRHRLQRKPLVNDPGMHHGTCVTHVPCCMSRSLTRGGGEKVPGIPGACLIHKFTYLVRGPWLNRRSTTTQESSVWWVGGCLGLIIYR